MKIITQKEIFQFYQKGFLIKKNFFKKKFIKNIANEINVLKSNNKLNVDRYYGKSIENRIN